MGKPNDPKYQKKVIRAAFNLLEAKSGPVLEDFSDVIPVKHGRMGYALPVDLVTKVSEIAETEGHHPDIMFGWGYSKIKILTVVVIRNNSFETI